PGSTPTSATRPDPIRPSVSPSTLTLAWLTRWMRESMVDRGSARWRQGRRRSGSRRTGRRRPAADPGAYWFAAAGAAQAATRRPPSLHCPRDRPPCPLPVCARLGDRTAALAGAAAHGRRTGLGVAAHRRTRERGRA